MFERSGDWGKWESITEFNASPTDIGFVNQHVDTTFAVPFNNKGSWNVRHHGWLGSGLYV
jgi:hypothetical protein